MITYGILYYSNNPISQYIYPSMQYIPSIEG